MESNGYRVYAFERICARQSLWVVIKAATAQQSCVTNRCAMGRTIRTSQISNILFEPAGLAESLREFL